MVVTKLVKNTWWMAVLLAAGASCKVETSTSTLPSAYSSGGGEVASGDNSPAAGGPSCPTPADHCLEPDDLLVGDEAFRSGYLTVKVGKQVSPPNPSGEAMYMILQNGENKSSRFAYRTHKAAPEEVVIGALVAALDTTNDQSIYRAPNDRQEASQYNWFIARIVSVDPASQGYVIVSGGYRVALSALRIVEGDDGPRLTAPGPEDAHFLKPEHWMVGNDPLPTSNYTTVRAALAIQPPSPQTKNEGEFLLTTNGERVWSPHAWRTRLATPADIKLGAYVVALDTTNDHSVYRAPSSREETLQYNWFVAKITDTSESYKGVVTVSGGYRVAVNALRVLVK
jgi:hypothetical protein